jgi:hypothetical protein
MATLQLEFNCLCLFVRDGATNVVHVLLPATHAHHRHAIRLVHPGFTDHPHRHRPMEGWAWELGPSSGNGTADLPSLATIPQGEIIDVTRVTSDASGHNGKKVKPAQVTGAHATVVSRVTLRAGSAIDSGARPYRWKVKGRDVRMAHQVLWEIDNVPDVQVWRPLSNPVPKPIEKLSDLGTPGPLGNGKHGYRIRVFHTLPAYLPPNHNNGMPDSAMVTEHFRHFYDLLGHQPTPDQLPRKTESAAARAITADEEVATYNCGAAQGELGP